MTTPLLAPCPILLSTLQSYPSHPPRCPQLLIFPLMSCNLLLSLFPSGLPGCPAGDQSHQALSSPIPRRRNSRNGHWEMLVGRCQGCMDMLQFSGALSPQPTYPGWEKPHGHGSPQSHNCFLSPSPTFDHIFPCLCPWHPRLAHHHPTLYLGHRPISAFTLVWPLTTPNLSAKRW